MINEYTWHTFPNLGYIHFIIPEEDLKPIRSEVKQLLKTKPENLRMNANLAGNIEHEFRLKKCHNHIEKLLTPMADAYIKEFDYKDLHNLILPDNTKGQWFINNIWCNEQQRTEFNPAHLHTGILSFVIWLAVPFFKEQEKKLWPRTAPDQRKAGDFDFFYTDALGNIKTHVLPVDKTWEGRAVIFPAKMLHAVYPFFSTEQTRISISGNFFLKS